MSIVWNPKVLKTTKPFVCGFCDKDVASNKGWKGRSDKNSDKLAYIYICPNCSNPTYFDTKGYQIPGVSFGNSVENLPDEINSLYEEARNSYVANSCTASVMCCRKLLMNIAVSKDANTGKNFKYYVNYLSDKGYIPPNGKDWVDHIRDKGNEANHEIAIMGKQDAEELLTFIEMLLKFIYEFPKKINT